MGPQAGKRESGAESLAGCDGEDTEGPVSDPVDEAPLRMMKRDTYCLYSSVNLRVAAALPERDELNMIESAFQRS